MKAIRNFLALALVICVSLEALADWHHMRSVSAQSNTFAALGLTNNFVGIDTFASLNGAIAVDGTLYPMTDAGIQAAINAAPDGGTVHLPEGIYSACTTLPIAITKRINIVGDGWGSLIQVCATASGTTDIFHIVPGSTAGFQGVRMQDFAISPASGAPARYAINIDAANGPVGYFVINHVRIDQLGGSSISTTNAAGSVQGTPYILEIAGSSVLNGINCDFCGDTLNIYDSEFAGSFPLYLNPTPNGSAGGAHGLHVVGNNITSTGGVQIKNGWAGTFSANEIEIPTGLTEPNGAGLDIDGTSSSPIQNLVIENNYIAMGTTGTDIRVNYAQGTILKHNFLSPSILTGTYSILTTAVADRTIGELNWVAPYGLGISRWLSDNGTNSNISFISPATGNPTNLNELDLTRIGQSAASKLAGTAICSSSSATLTFSPAFASNPTIIATDANPSATAHISARSTSGATITCSGASDTVDWLAIGNPN